jgi:hypothetical protein
MEIQIVEAKEIDALTEQLIGPDGRIRLLPAAFYSRVPLPLLRVWCNRTARYQIPTVELVEWLKDQIAGKRAIEIGSGNGDLYHHLGIPGTDNYCQQLPEVQLHYGALGQIPTNPPEDVVRMDALEAIDHYRPDVVIGCWITHRYEESHGTGNMYGPDEREIIRQCRYIHIGNRDTHGQKPILTRQHFMPLVTGLVSRAGRQEQNCCWVWCQQDD